MKRRILLVMSLVLCFQYSVLAEDFGHHVVGDEDLSDGLLNSKNPGMNPFIPGESEDYYSTAQKTDDPIFNPKIEKIGAKKELRHELKDSGYTVPGTYENAQSFLEFDKKNLTKDYRKASSGAINLSYIHNGYNYDSTNNIIDTTISSGPKSVKGGSLLVRNDSYLYRSDFANLHWSLGVGLGYNSGQGIFVTGERSDTKFSLWEVPVDLGIGAEINLGSWAKIAGTGGPSVMGLLQDRSDFERGEKGKRKIQYSPGYFTSAQLKINLSSLSPKSAHEIFTESEITNLLLNIEVRHQNYSSFQDEITLNGTSFGLGFTFEYL